MTERVCINVDRFKGRIQLSIDVEREGGCGHGYRICGPKYCGLSEKLEKHYLTQSDAQQIYSYIKPLLPTDTRQVAVLDTGYELGCEIIQHMGNDLVFVVDQMPPEDQSRFFALLDKIKVWTITAGSVLDQAATILPDRDDLRDRIAAALGPCLERAHNEFQLAETALAVMRDAQ